MMRSCLSLQCPRLAGALRGIAFAEQWHLAPGMEYPHATVRAGRQLGRSSSTEKDLGMLVDNNCAGVSRAAMQCWRLMAYCTALGNASQQTEVIIPFYLAFVRQDLECCHQFWVPQYQKNDDKLEKGRWRATEMAGGTVILWRVWERSIYSAFPSPGWGGIWLPPSAT